MRTMLDQLCWELGFPTKNLHLYLSGPQTSLITLINNP